MNLPDFMSSDWFGAAVMGLVTWVGHRVWSRTSDKNQKKLEAAIREASSVIEHLSHAAADDTTIEQFVIWCKGAVAVQMAKVGINLKKNALAQALVNELIARSVTHFATQIRDRLKQKPPILTKIPADKLGLVKTGVEISTTK